MYEILETVVGRLNDWDEHTGFVELFIDNNSIIASCDIHYLKEASIFPGDEFKTVVYRENEEVKVKFEKLKPKEISPERIKEILEKVDQRFQDF